MALQAGAIMLKRLHQLADEQKDFAFESTGASRSFAVWLQKLKSKGYEFHLYFFGLRNPEVAIARVAERVRMGGHHVPPDTVRRRYDLGLQNVFKLYLPLATTWELIDNNDVAAPRTIAKGAEILETTVQDVTRWKELTGKFNL